MIKVSVICLAYNHEKYIRSALEGFVNQKTNFAYEVLVHDDASTDRTASIIAEYAERYPDIIKPVCQKVNQYSQNVDIMMEYLLPLATGEYFAFCEGDDYWTDENKLQMQVDFLDQHPEYSACVHNSYLLEMLTKKQTVMYEEVDRDLYTTDVINGGSCCYQTASLMHRRDALFHVPAFVDGTEEIGDDYTWAIYLSLIGPIRFLGKVMSLYRVGTESSWTAAHRKDIHENAVFHKAVGKMLREVNEYTNFVHNQQIEELIHYNRYMELYFDERYSEMRKPEYSDLYQKETWASRIKMRLKQYFNPMYHLYRKLKY